MQLVYIFIILASVLPSKSLKILGLFPHRGITHFYFFHPIMRGLAENGHDVTVVSQFPDAKAPKNYKDLVVTGMQTMHNELELHFFENPTIVDHFFEFPLLKKWGLEACHTYLNSSVIRKLLNSKTQYDVVLIEQFNSDCMMAVAWKLKVPVIGLSSCPMFPYHNDRMGNPDTPSFIPSIFVLSSEKMSFMERFGNFVSNYFIKYFYEYDVQTETDKIVRKYLGDGIPPVNDLAKKTSLMFVNQHYSFSGAQPRSPSVIEIMGVHIGEPKPLDEDLKNYLDSSTNGVILLSWGSIVKSDSLPKEKREAIINVLGSLKQNVIWKWPNDTLENKPNNVMIHKWVPQRDILCHPNVRLFWTHGGSMGAGEAIHCGVPTIVTPFYGDQFLNAAAFAHRGAGHVLRYNKLSETTLREAINAALSPQTLENAQKLSYSFRNRIQSPLKTALWWVEHVAETGGAPLLKSNSVNMSAFAYHSYDVILALITGLLAAVYSWVWVLKRVFCRGNRTVKSKVQ